MLNLLTEPLIRVRTGEGDRRVCSLPEVFSLLVRDAVAEFPALRPHQRHPWHAFLVQVAALALHRAGETEPPEEEQDWAALLRGLTPEWPEDEPWSLVAPPDRPAFMQAPIADGDLSVFKPDLIEAPDALDMLVTSKNHDLKSEVMVGAHPDDWLFALVSLQTMEGFMGQGNYGISRMNGGFASRPAVGVLPPGASGARFLRDLRVFLRARDKILETTDLRGEGGIGLVWLQPWAGEQQIAFRDLDPFYIEICRRVRLQDDGDGLRAIGATSKKARIDAAALKGNTGDPWTPIERKEAKALSITGEGFSYRRMTELMLGETYQRPFLQELQRDDADEGLAIIASSVARGQGKTEGYHERIVPISNTVTKLLRRQSTDRLAAQAKERVDEAGTMRGKVLRPALFALLQQGPEDIAYGKKTTGPQAEQWLQRFERAVDAEFFPDLWREAEAETEEERKRIRRKWWEKLAKAAKELLDDAARSTPQSAMRRYRAQVRARDLFSRLLYSPKNFSDLKREETHDTAD
ncbi:MAG: type I-E CRISPR-associated protein Cse1/CasA [Rhodospirillales bacterium]